MSAVLVLLVLAVTGPLPALAETGKTEITKESLKTPEDIASYGMGLGMGKNSLKKLPFNLNFDVFIKGIEDGYLDEGKQLMSDEALQKEMKKFQESLKEKHQEEMEKKATENKVKGEKFLAENKKKKGVVTLPSGLQYKIIKAGTGPTPKATDKVEVHYKGTTIDGAEFDSSYARNKPASFYVNQVVKGWTEALQLMKVGAKWQLFIPPELGYGVRGAGRNIGPNETLLFNVELLGIEASKATQKKGPAPKKK